MEKFAGERSRIDSPLFSVEGHADIQFFMTLECKVGEDNDQKHFGVDLHCLLGEALNEVPVSFVLTILSKKGRVRKDRTGE